MYIYTFNTKITLLLSHFVCGLHMHSSNLFYFSHFSLNYCNINIWKRIHNKCMSDIAQINNFVEQQRFNDAARKKKFLFFILFWLQCAIMCASFNPTILTIIIYKTPSILLTPGVNSHKLIYWSIKYADYRIYTYIRTKFTTMF